MKRWVILVLIFCGAIQTSHAQTRRISFLAPGVYPEGVAYDSIADRFFVSSATTGTIGVVDRQGTYKIFYEDHDLKSTFGMKIHPKSGRLWVCAGDPNYSIYKTPATYKKQIRLIAIDVTTAKKVADIDLSTLYPGNHFANDLVVDEKGTIYVTDSYSPVIYAVDAAGKPTIFATSDLFKGVGIGLNGIVWDKAGYLLAVNDANGTILKITTDRREVSVVKIRQQFPGADGIWLNGKLFLVQNKGVNAVSVLSSDDNWKTAKLESATSALDRFQNPSTLAQKGMNVYALNAKLNELTDSTMPRSKEFSLQLVEPKPVK